MVTEITTLVRAIQVLDQAVAESTGLRKKENGLYLEEIQANRQASQLIEMAKSKLSAVCANKGAALLQGGSNAGTQGKSPATVFSMLDGIMGDLERENHEA